MKHEQQKDLRTHLKVKESYVAALQDDCTRLTYTRKLPLKADTL